MNFGADLLSMAPRRPAGGAAGTCLAWIWAATLLAGAAGAAQEPHPRLWLGAADLPRLRALAADPEKNPLGIIPAEAFAALKQEAGRYLAEPAFSYSVSMPGKEGGPAKTWSYTLSDEAPPRHDDYAHYPCWTGLSRAIETRLVSLAFAALVTQETPYFEKARELALHLCRWPGSWTDPSYGNEGACLDTAHLANAVALFYDWCFAQLTPAERSLLCSTLDAKAVVGLTKAIPAYGAQGWPNGFAVQTAALGTCAVALQNEEPRAAEWLALSLRHAREFLDTQGRDGGCMEGPGYGTYGADTLAHFMLALDTAGLPDPLLEHPFFTTLPAYSIGLLAPASKQQTGFGDAWFVQPFGLCMTLLALKGNAEAAWYLQEIGALQCRSIEEFLTIALHPAAFAAPRRPEWNPSRAFVDVGYAALRDGYDPSAAFMAFKCGPPTQVVGHNHYDHNSFQINYAGTWIATDPGYTGYFDPPDNKYGRCTFGHNTVTLDADAEYLRNMRFPLAGHDQVRLDGARIVAYHSSPRFDYVKGAAAVAYDPAAAAETRIHFWRAGEGSGFTRLEGPRPTSGEWARYEFSGVVPADAATSCLALEFSGAQGSVWYDDAEVLLDGQKLDLPNPGFEDGLTHWSPRVAPGQTGTQEIDERVAHSGSRSARIDAPGGYYYWLPRGERLQVRPGQRIAASFWARCTSGDAILRQADREVLFIKPQVFVTRDTLAAPQAHRYSYVLHALGGVEILSPSQAVLVAPGTARLEAHVFSPAGMTLDTAAFPGAEQRGPYLNCVTGPVAATVISSVLIAREAAFGLANPGFEAGLSGWLRRDAEGCAKNHVIDEQVVHSGRRSGRIDGPGGYYYTPRFRVTPGNRVRVRFWAKLDGPQSRWATVYWWHAGKTSGNATGQEQGPLVAGNEWRAYEFSATVPPTVVEACAALNFFGDGRVWYDDVEVSLEPQRPAQSPAQVNAVADGSQGLAIVLDGLQHLVAFGTAGRPSEVSIAGRRLGMDGAMACVSLDAQGKVLASWLLDGTALRLDDQTLTPVTASAQKVERGD